MGFHLSGPITAISLENLKLETELRRPGPERLPADPMGSGFGRHQTITSF